MPFQEVPGQSIPGNIKEVMAERTRAEVGKQVRVDMKDNGSTEAVDREIVYRMSSETEAIKALSESELTVAWKFGHSAAEYLQSKNR